MHGMLFEAEGSEAHSSNQPGDKECLVKKVMYGAEEQMYLNSQEVMHGWITSLCIFEN
ncbi:hypothetical protein [Paenibacillus plantiphilus]|uniref:hypothetical protein n=1 Tax=Paenibacillus plantiphilus TaxID=2905650 RepID=UPI001F15860D|nr:hypothetical protein [Paenibacillus plantiphilus]